MEPTDEVLFAFLNDTERAELHRRWTEHQVASEIAERDARRPRVIAHKAVNLGQLSAELGDVPLNVSEETHEISVAGDEWTITQDELEAALEAHVAVLPPSSDVLSAERAAKVESVIERLGLDDGPADALRELLGG